MSLKSFHLVFVSCVMLFTALFGVWGLTQFLGGSDRAIDKLAIALMAPLALGVEIWYAKWFLHKMKREGWL